MKLKSILITLAILLAPNIALAERIVDFDSQMVINQDRSIDVTETITYDSEGLERQGVFRTIALDRKFVSNIRVFRNDRSEPILITRDWLNNNINIRIGQEEVYFTGIRQYTVQYKYNNIIQADNNLDILKHNITGNNWQMPIDKISTTIIFPQTLNPSDIIQIQCEIIDSKNKASDKCQSTKISDKIIQFIYNNTIPQNSGLEINFKINKDILDEAPLYFRIDIDRNIGLLILLIGIIFFTIIWLIWYKNKSIKYESVVQYTPPANLSPAGVGYLRYQRPHPRLISALMISLARQGIIKIKQNFDKNFWQRSKYNFELINKKKAQEVKYMGEAILLESLFQSYHMPSDMFFKKENLKYDYYINIKQHLVILTLSSITYIFINNGLIIFFISYFIYLIFWMAIVGSSRHNYRALYIRIYSEEITRYYVALPSVIKFLLSKTMRFYVVLIVFLYFLGFSIIPIAITIILMITMFLNNIKTKRTQAGDEMMAYILGFEEYIVVAEKHRLDFQGKNYLFFEILPYAIALGHENIWVKAFEGMTIDNPSWYDGETLLNSNFSTNSFYREIFNSMSNHKPSTILENLMSNINSKSSGDSFFGTGIGGGGGGGFGRGGGGGSW